jgi:hypothetical protein
LDGDSERRRGRRTFATAPIAGPQVPLSLSSQYFILQFSAFTS